MKKIIFLCIFLLMVSGIWACGKDRQDESAEPDGLAQLAEPIPEQEKIPEKEIVEIEAEPEKEPLTGEGTASFAGERRIEDQTFQITLQPLGQVTFASYRPDTSQNPLADVVFSIEKDGALLQKLAGESEDNCRSNQSFLQVDAVSFLDYNNDGYDDIITICSYSFASGPDAGTDYSEIRYYSGSESGAFSYEKQMSSDANAALAKITIETAKSFIGAGRNISLEPWQQAYIDYLSHDSLVESQQGYVLIYIDDDEIPELVEIGDCEATGCRIVNYAHGTVHVSQLNRLYFSYIEKENLLCNSEGNMDNYYDLIYQFKDGELALVAEGYYGAEDNSNVQFDEEGTPIYQYEWEGVEMSGEDYAKALNSVYDTSRAQDGYSYNEWHSVDEMIVILENY